MRRLSKSILVLCALGCANVQTRAPMSIAPLTPGPGERVQVSNTVSVVDSSNTVIEHGLWGEQKAVYQGFVSGMPEGSYHAGAVNFGGYQRQVAPLAPFSRTDLAQHAAGIAPLGEGTPIDRAISEQRAPLSSKGERTALVVWSDGLPTDPVGREIGNEKALAEAKAVASATKGTLCIYTVQAGDDPAGAAFLQQLSTVTGCGAYHTLAQLQDPANLTRFEREVFLGAAPRMAAATPGDEDGDGVLDDKDQCPHTPHGAIVDSRGCWTIQDLEFDTSSATIRPAGRERLERDVLPVLRENPTLRVRIDGHTDSRGSQAYNQALSDRRARSVKDFLVAAGISADRMETRGFGFSQPIAPNDTPENLQRNRRTELTVLNP